MNLSSTISIYGGGPGSGCHGESCGRPKSKLQEMLEHIRDSHVWGNQHVWLKLADYGHPGNVEPFTKEELEDLKRMKSSFPKCKLGFCYMNAQRMAMAGLANPKVQYVEGLVSVHGVPIDHAWIEYNGKIFDPTLMDASGKVKDKQEHEWFGVTVPKNEIMKHQLATKVYSPLTQSYKNETLQKKIWSK